MILHYNYHDAILETITLEGTTLKMHISLYSLYYPTRPKIQLIFTGISNTLSCKKWMDILLSSYQEPDENTLGARIDCFILDVKHPNTIRLVVDAIPPLKLRFTTLEESCTNSLSKEV